MASIHVEHANLRFDRIGSLWQDKDTDQFIVGAEIETGQGPWETSEQYFSAVVRHRLQVAEADASPDVREGHLSVSLCKSRILYNVRDASLADHMGWRTATSAPKTSLSTTVQLRGPHRL